MKGYQELREDAAWINLSGRGEIMATGEDRARLLHAMSTNHIQGLEEGQGCYVFFLNAQGRILADANILNVGDSLLIDTEPETRSKLFAHLDQYIIADDVTLTDETENLAVVGIEGPHGSEKLNGIGIPLPTGDYNVVSWGQRFVAKISATGQPGYRIYLPSSELAALVSELESTGITESDAAAVETVRLENGKPRYGADITERYLSQETNQMHALSFSKGCYLGQEIVERVRSRAQIHRMLSPVRIEAQSPPPPRTKLRADEKDVGEITSSAFSPAHNQVVALAYVRVEQIQARSEMMLAGSEPDIRAYIP
jgi:tRNA-modifying protein YgfZ